MASANFAIVNEREKRHWCGALWTMAARAKLVRNTLTEQTNDVKNKVDRLMTPSEFKLLKRYLLPDLRAKDDPPPRVVEPGKGDRTQWFTNVRELLEKTPNGKPVRGYKLFVVPLDVSVWQCPAWKAQFHMVIHRPSDTNARGVYECANVGHTDEESSTPFVFVPSSRAHPDISDAELLADKYLPGCVVGGNTVFADAICIDQRVRGRRYSGIATCPEMCVLQRNVVVRLLPHYTEWYKLRAIHVARKDDMQNLAEQMGMPTFNVGEPVDEHDLDMLYEQVTLNTESLICGLEGIKMEMEARRALMSGETMFERVRDDFFAYFDRSHQKVCDVIEERLATQYDSQRLSCRA